MLALAQTVIPGCASWRRPGIHTPDGGYGFRARSLGSRPGMTTEFILTVPTVALTPAPAPSAFPGSAGFAARRGLLSQWWGQAPSGTPGGSPGLAYLPLLA